MIVGVGIHLVDIGDFKWKVRQHPQLLADLFSPVEHSRMLRTTGEHLSAAWAVKQAVAQALSVPDEADWHACEITDWEGLVDVVVHETWRDSMPTDSDGAIHVSVSYSAGQAVAVAIIEG